MSILENDMAEKQMTVTAENGKPVNLRTGPGEKYTRITAVPVGRVVTVITAAEGWAYVEYDGHSGYMKLEFLRETEAADKCAADERVRQAVKLLKEAEERMQQAEALLGMALEEKDA